MVANVSGSLAAASSFLGAAVPLPQGRKALQRRRAVGVLAGAVPLPPSHGTVHTGVQQVLPQLASVPAIAKPSVGAWRAPAARRAARRDRQLTPLAVAFGPSTAAVPVAIAAAAAGAGVASLLKGGKTRVYGKGLAQFLPSNASDLAKNIACVPPAVALARDLRAAFRAAAVAPRH